MSKMKEWLLDRQLNGDDGTGYCDYEQKEICLVCSGEKDNNGLVVCSDCNEPDLPCCGACGQFYGEKETALDGFHSADYCQEASV